MHLSRTCPRRGLGSGGPGSGHEGTFLLSSPPSKARPPGTRQAGALTWSNSRRLSGTRAGVFAALLLYFFVTHVEEIDQRWIEHLKNMEALREGIGLRATAEGSQAGIQEGGLRHLRRDDGQHLSRNLCQKLFICRFQRDESEAAAKQMADRQAKRRPRPTIE